MVKGLIYFVPTMFPLCSNIIFPYIYSPNIPPHGKEKRLLVFPERPEGHHANAY